MATAASQQQAMGQAQGNQVVAAAGRLVAECCAIDQPAELTAKSQKHCSCQ